MGITIHYHAAVGEEQRIDEATRHFDRPDYNPRRVDFVIDRKWIKQGYLYQPDYRDNWEKYSLGSWADIIRERHGGKLPAKYKGIIFNIDEGCEPLWFAFGLYPDAWHCRHFTKTQFAKGGFATHVKAINLLGELKSYVDELEVYDEVGFWETRNLMEAARIFGQSEEMIKSLGNLLKDIASQHGLTVESGYDLSYEIRKRKEEKHER